MVLLDNFQDILESLPQNATLNLPVCKKNSLKINFGNDNEDKAIYNGTAPVLPFANSDVFYASIPCWRRLTAVNENCKAVYEVTFDVKDSNFFFKAGDTIGIIPSNDEVDVNSIISHLELTSTVDLRYTLCVDNSQKSSKIPAHIPVKSTIRNVLTHCVDLRSVLKKLFLLALSRHTKDEHERRILEYFCSKEGSTAYQNHILDRNLCILDLFTIFKSCKPPIQVLLANLPRLLPRPYSIVNSSIKNPNILKICFSVLLLHNNKKGLTTGWLENMILNQECDLENRMRKLAINDCDMFKVPIYLRKNISCFSLPERMEKPIILIGPGTGVAPFIAFLEEREIYKHYNPDKLIGDVWLFFGCRHPELDFLYKEQLNEFFKKGVLTKLITAFSRLESSKNKYIQDALMQNSNEITQLLESDASIFVCGDVKNIAAHVKETIIQCLITSGKSLEEVNQIIASMQKEKKYVVDVWS